MSSNFIREFFGAYFFFPRALQFSNVGAARVAASVDGISVSAASDEDGAAVRLDGRDVTAAAAAAGRPEPRRRRRRRAGKPAGLSKKCSMSTFISEQWIILAPGTKL